MSALNGSFPRPTLTISFYGILFQTTNHPWISFSFSFSIPIFISTVVSYAQRKMRETVRS